ncbi:hypothetical protein TNCV_3712751 [Trichonephila clavipes]|nr:hypothetical protein TNCV_3712751 [Trichonephila clavipes]
MSKEARSRLRRFVNAAREFRALLSLFTHCDRCWRAKVDVHRIKSPSPLVFGDAKPANPLSASPFRWQAAPGEESLADSCGYLTQRTLFEQLVIDVKAVTENEAWKKR